MGYFKKQQLVHAQRVHVMKFILIHTQTVIKDGHGT